MSNGQVAGSGEAAESHAPRPALSAFTNQFLLAVARKFWPELEGMPESRRLVGAGEVITVLIAAPLALAGLIWLVLVTDPAVFTREWRAFLLFAVLIVLFERVGYFIIMEIIEDRYGSADGSLSSMILWTACLLFGPTAIWLSVLTIAVRYAWNTRRTFTTVSRWNWMRGLSLDLATVTLAFLAALAAYERWGGRYPLPGLSLEAILPALGAVFVNFGLILVIWIGYISYSIAIQRVQTPAFQPQPIVRFTLLALGLPILAHPYAILAAGIYVREGVWIYLFYMSAVLLVAYLARRLSWAAESSRQGSRQLEKLEHLSRELITAPPDASTLPEILAEHVPAMFPSSRVAIWLAPERLLMRDPEEWSPDLDQVWSWSQDLFEKDPQAAGRPHEFLANEPLPWSSPASHSHDPMVVGSILDVENRRPVGLVYLELRTLAQPWDRRSLTSLFHAVNSLAEQVASALHQARVYEDTLAYQGAVQELNFAGRIQASFLPSELPRMDGWELAVTLLPARETSGDFFDFIPLAEDKIGILIADVADKGLGAALYMALSRTLIRTYALEYVDATPELILFAANERILQDARANLFVTAFYGILDQKTGILSYANAGHNPPYLVSRDGGTAPLNATGMPIGIDEDAVWGQGSIQILPGDALLLYTDGIPDAQNPQGELFREKRLVEVAQANLATGAQELQAAILTEIENFVGDAPQFDDITLLVLLRDLPGKSPAAKRERKEPSGIPALYNRRVV